MGKGKRKIRMEKIENQQYRMVTFSKRRKGLFNKAQELCSLTGSSIAALVLSEAGRPHVFGAPSFDSVAHQFLTTTHHYSAPAHVITSSDVVGASTFHHGNDAVPLRSAVTDSQCQIQNKNDDDDDEVKQWGTWLDDKFGIDEDGDCESVEQLVEMKNTLMQLRQSVAYKILCRHGPETLLA